MKYVVYNTHYEYGEYYVDEFNTYLEAELWRHAQPRTYDGWSYNIYEMEGQ